MSSNVADGAEQFGSLPPSSERARGADEATVDDTSPAAPVATDDVPRGDADPPANTPGGIDLRFRPDVEGLRAIAVVLVVLYHCHVAWASGGFIGVDVFFVISGFLITGLLLREHEKRETISFPGFYARRARRILPAAMLVVIVVVLMGHHFENLIAYGYLQSDAKACALFFANFHFANIGTNYFSQAQASTPSPLLHYWSLAVEEQFYFVWPLVVFLVGFIAKGWWSIRRVVMVTALLACVASFLWSLHQTDVNPTWAYYSPFTRAWELGVGALAATLVPEVSRLPRWSGMVLAWAGLVAIGWGGYEFSGTTHYPGTAALVPVLGATAIIVGGASGLGASHLLAYRPVRAVGRVSYGWYLLHYPPMILLTGVYYFGPLPIHENVIIALVTLGLAFVMYDLLEKPIRVSKTLAVRPWTSIAMGLGCVAAAFLVAALYHPSPLP